MRKHPVLLIFCALAVVSCARPISVKVTTTPIDDVELTLNRTVSTSDTETTDATDEAQQKEKLRVGYSPCVFEDVPQGSDLTITAAKEGYQVKTLTIPAHAGAWSSLLWTKNDPRSRYLEWKNERGEKVDLAEDGVEIHLEPVPNTQHYKPETILPFSMPEHLRESD